LVEFGCGAGKVLEYLVANGLNDKETLGIDISKELLDLAREVLPNTNFIEGDIATIDLPTSEFDIILSVRVFEYLDLEGLRSAMQNAHNALKNDGVLHLIIGHPLRVNDGDIRTYLERGVREVALPWGLKVPLYHKTISDYVAAGLSSGFTLSYIEETSLPGILKEENPEKFDNYESYGAVSLVLTFRK